MWCGSPRRLGQAGLASCRPPLPFLDPHMNFRDAVHRSHRRRLPAAHAVALSPSRRPPMFTAGGVTPTAMQLAWQLAVALGPLQSCLAALRYFWGGGGRHAAAGTALWFLPLNILCALFCVACLGGTPLACRMGGACLLFGTNAGSLQQPFRCQLCVFRRRGCHVPCRCASCCRCLCRSHSRGSWRWWVLARGFCSSGRSSRSGSRARE